MLNEMMGMPDSWLFYWGWRFSLLVNSFSFQPFSAAVLSSPEPSAVVRSQHRDPWPSHLLWCSWKAELWTEQNSSANYKGIKSKEIAGEAGECVRWKTRKEERKEGIQSQGRQPTHSSYFPALKTWMSTESLQILWIFWKWKDFGRRSSRYSNHLETNLSLATTSFQVTRARRAPLDLLFS